MLTSTRAGGHGGSYWTHVSLIWGSLWPRLTHAMLVSSKHGKHNTFNKQEPPTLFVSPVQRDMPSKPDSFPGLPGILSCPATTHILCGLQKMLYGNKCWYICDCQTVHMRVSLHLEVFIHGPMLAPAVSQVRPMSTFLGRRLITFVRPRCRVGACWWWGMGERRGPGVTSSWAPGRGQSILTHPFLQISLCHSISNFVSYVHNLFVPTVISSLPELRFISDIWSRHVEACTTHLVSVCDPFLRPPVCVWLCDTHCATIFCPFYLWLGLATIHRGTAALHLRRLRYLSTITRAHQHKLKRNKQMKSMIHVWCMHVWSMYIKCMSAGTY